MKHRIIMKKNLMSMMAAVLLVVGLTSCGGNSKKGSSTINAICDMMDDYYQMRKSGESDAFRKADEYGEKYLEKNSSNLTFDVETDETTPVKTSNFKFGTSILPTARFTGEIHLETESDLGTIQLIPFHIIPELSIVFYHDDLPIYVSGVIYEPTSGQKLVLNV